MVEATRKNSDTPGVDHPTRGPAVEWPRIVEKPGIRPPSATPASEPTPSKGALSGTWRGSEGELFRIEDDGKILTVELISDNPSRTAKGTISRRDDKPEFLKGSLVLVWPTDAPNSHQVHVTGTIRDQNTLRLRFTKWIQMEGRKVTGYKGIANDVWARSGAAPAGQRNLFPAQE